MMGKILRPAGIGGRSKAFFPDLVAARSNPNVHRAHGPIGAGRGRLRHAILNRYLDAARP
jgi:hypothetical protein